jgi:hypothetical protein
VTDGSDAKWLQKGRLSGHQITKGMPWRINLSATGMIGCILGNSSDSDMAIPEGSHQRARELLRG